VPQPFLAEITDASLASASGECLSLFLQSGEDAAGCLTDPVLVGERVAAGHWQLLGVDDQRRRAYYARIEHGPTFDCAGRTRGAARAPSWRRRRGSVE
jgi:hypothetical protein